MWIVYTPVASHSHSHSHQPYSSHRSPQTQQPTTDLSLREAFLELLQCYQLPWLQLGLEAVCGVEIDKVRLATGRDGQLVRLSTLSALRGVIAQRVLADPDISRRYGATGPKLVHGRAREAMLQDLRGHLLERFLCLVALLDHGKHLELLTGGLPRRPLFRAAAPHKSSAALLHEFAKLYMAGEGDLAKHLRIMGYGVGIQQTFLGASSCFLSTHD